MTDILLVDDERMIRNVYQRVLNSKLGELNPEFRHAEDGQEALNAVLDGYRPDILITDGDMPRMGGVELLKKLQEKGYEFPRFMVTGQPSQERYNTVRELSGAGILAKPYKVDDLVKITTELLNPEYQGRSPTLDKIAQDEGWKH